jgi:hypothetical protein
MIFSTRVETSITGRNLLGETIPNLLSWSDFSGLRSDGAVEKVILEPKRHGDEQEVEDEHAEAHRFRHLPAKQQN